MKRKLTYALFSLLCLLHQNSQAQYYTGYNTSNYAGINAVSINPANIVDSRYIVDMNLIGMDLRLANNYLGLSTDLFRFKNSPFGDTAYSGHFQNFRADFFKEKNKNHDARLFQNLQFQGPSIAFNIGKNSFAITSGVREYFFFDHLEPNTANMILAELKDSANWDFNLDNHKFNAVSAIWSEVGVVYGREIWSNGEHYIKGAVHPKILLAAGCAYFYADRLHVNFHNNDTLNVDLSNIRFGYSNNLVDGDIFQKPYASNLLKKTSFAMDFGFVYEWRPKHKDYHRTPPRDTTKLVRYKNKYKLKVGMSFTDIGWLRFDRGTFGGNFEGTATNWDLRNMNIQGVESFGKLMQDTFNMTTNRDPFKIRLPSALSLQVDYKIWKGFYANFTGYMAFSHNNSPLQLHALNYWTITPRFEHYWVDFGLPFSINGMGNIESGLSLRLGPVFIGSSNVWNFMVGNSVKGVNFYSGLKLAIPYTKPHDKKPKPIKLDTTKVDTPNIEPIKVDSPKVDTPKIEPIPIDSPKVDTGTQIKIEPVKPDTPKIEPIKVDSPKVEPVKIDTPKVIDEDPEEIPIQVDTTSSDEKRYIYQGHEFKIKPLLVTLADNAFYFNSGSSTLSSKEKLRLDSVVTFLQKTNSVRVLAHGFTDIVGSSSTNDQLSIRRAEAVKKYLVSKGIDKDRIVTDGFGYEKPVAANDNEEGRKLNRRVEVFIILEDKILVPINEIEPRK